ncbi:pachytene checkpoint protein 2 homolog [Ixodes scapularis]
MPLSNTYLVNGDKDQRNAVTMPPIHAEILKTNRSALGDDQVVRHVEGLLRLRGYPSTMTRFDDTPLSGHVEKVLIEYPESEKDNLAHMPLVPHVYHVNADEMGVEELEDGMAAANHWVLPSAEFEGLWESLVFDSKVKDELLSYSSTALLYSDKNVDHNIVSWNKVVLLHGPPGTGKTSLCKALAQKLTIRHNSRFKYGQLIEINSHSLFSKWFSESGKLVMKMFQKIQSLIDDEDSIIFVLIDEVESLAHCRKAAIGGNEPSDAIRVVNSLLTQIDSIKKYPNVFVLTTSNITGVIDLAFVDRADIRRYLGYPSQAAILKIFESCIEELQRAGIIQGSVKFLKDAEHENGLRTFLESVCSKSVGLSGRTLRRLPFIAHAIFAEAQSLTPKAFLVALSSAVDSQMEDDKDIITL